MSLTTPPLASGLGATTRAQRAKIIGHGCIVCQQTKGLTPTRLAPPGPGGCNDLDCVVPMCWPHRHLYELGQLDLLHHLEPRWRREIAHAVSHLGLITTYRHLTGGRLPAADLRRHLS